jgi:hypothetical protein
MTVRVLLIQEKEIIEAFIESNSDAQITWPHTEHESEPYNIIMFYLNSRSKFF